MTQHTAKTQRADVPATDMSVPRAVASHLGAVGADAHKAPKAPYLEDPAPDAKQGARTAADVAPKPASQPKPKPKPKAEFPETQGGKKNPGTKGAAKPGTAGEGNGQKGKLKKGKIDIATGVRLIAGIVACLTMPLLMGEMIQAAFHLHKAQAILLNLALYPFFVVLFIWLFVRTLFKPVADAGAKTTQLPPEASDHGTRDDGSLLM